MFTFFNLRKIALKMWIRQVTEVLLFCVIYVDGQRDREDPSLSDKARKELQELTFDQIILRTMAGGSNRVAASLTLPDPNRTLAELDMVLTKKQYDAMYGAASKSRRKKRKAVIDSSVYWPDARVPYKFAPDHFSSYEQWMIKVAMREWERYTCIRFHEAKSTDSNYVYFQDGLGCNSQLGMVGGAQTLNLDKGGCRFKGLYLHEIAHALGVVHEHQRPIRDDYIKILYQNVEPSMRIWFQKYNPEAIRSFNVDYEYSSVMHYGVTAFSGNSQQTIRAKDPSRESEIGRVYAKELSFTDVEIVNRMYNCVRRLEDCNGKRCTGKGYLDQNCNCLCPDGSRDCYEGKTQDTSCRNNGDTRENWLCYIWARQGECERNPGYMLSNCAKACGQCGDERKLLADDGICQNVYDDVICDKWKEEVGDCRVSEHFMKVFCRKSCGYCNDYTLNRTPPQTLCANAHPNDTACETWARQGECIINPRWMPLNCRKACFTCPFDKNQLPTVKPSDASTLLPTTTPRTTRPPTVTTQTTTRKPVEDCTNRYPDKDCDIWAKYDHCNINPTFMEANCMKSCKVCQSGGTSTNTGEGTDTMASCKDTWQSPTDCELWAKHQHCVINPSFMLKMCKKSCRACTEGLRQAADEVSFSTDDGTNSSSKVTGALTSLIVLLFSLMLIT